MIKLWVSEIKKSHFKYFLLKMVIFFALVFILDYSIGNVLRYFYFKQDSGFQYRTTFSIERTTAEIIIFGSSRANHNYDPGVFENQLKLTYYNVGRDGTDILYYFAVLNGVLSRYSPKTIILDFNKGEFVKNKNSYDRLSSLLPYYNGHPEMRQVIELKGKFEKIKMLSCIYPYNSSVFAIVAGNAEFNKRRSSDIKGYVPIKKTWEGSIQIDRSQATYETDSIKVKAYEAFIQKCISSKVTLYVVCSPSFVKTDHTDYSVKIAGEISKRNSIHFFDYSRDSAFINNPGLFADISHLNEAGAKYFSGKLIDDIKKAFESQPGKILPVL